MKKFILNVQVIHLLKTFQSSVEFYIETSHLSCKANQNDLFLHEMQRWREMG